MAKPVTPSWAYSYAHYVGGALRLDLQVSDLDAADAAGARVQIRHEKATKTAPATVGVNSLGVHLEAVFAPAKLRTGMWELWLSPRAGAKYEPVNARVIVATNKPVALLTGTMPVSVTPDPVHTVKRRRKVLRKLGTAADRVLVELPPERAQQVCGVLRTAARKAVSVLP